MQHWGVLNIGSSSVHVGMLTAIYIGLPMITQLLFAGFLAGRSRKKPFLLVGIYLRVLALTGMGYTLSISSASDSGRVLFMIFLWIGIFAVSGAFAGISYTDLNCRDTNRVLWFYFNLYYNFSAGYDIIIFFEAYKMQHSLIPPSTAIIRINVAGKILFTLS